LGGRPDRAPTTKDRLKDDEKVDEVNSFLNICNRSSFSITSWQKVTVQCAVVQTMKSKIYQIEYFSPCFSYFNASDEERESRSRKDNKDSEEEEDDLDAFMAGINEQAKKDVSASKVKGDKAIKTGETSGGRAGRDDIEKEDAQEEYMT
jgi:hypothetical protein